MGPLFYIGFVLLMFWNCFVEANRGFMAIGRFVLSRFVTKTVETDLTYDLKSWAIGFFLSVVVVCAVCRL